jgi:acetolactate synthase-1/2/3 large subunit
MKMSGNQRVFTNVGCASMGYGLPAAIGACIANKKHPVICIEGDGSIMMNLQELQTIMTYNLPVKIFLINNGGYTSIKQTQNTFFKGHLAASTSETGVKFPNFKLISEAFGLEYFRIMTNPEVDHYIQQVIESNGPCLCEIHAHPYEPFEPKVVSKGIDKDGKIIPGELTDMYVSEGF